MAGVTNVARQSGQPFMNDSVIITASVIFQWAFLPGGQTDQAPIYSFFFEPKYISEETDYAAA